MAGGSRAPEGSGAGGGGPQDRPPLRRGRGSRGPRPEAGVEALTDELIGAVVTAVRPAGPNGHGSSWQILLGWEEQIRGWVAGGEGHPPLSIVKIEELLARQGCVAPYRTLHRFAVEVCGFRVKSNTVRVADGEPGVECQIDFAQMGFIVDPDTGKRRPGARPDLHRRRVAAHVRVVDLLPDADRDDRGL